MNRDIVGTFSIVAGLVIIFAALGNIIFRLIIALLGLFLVWYGINLRGRSSFIIWSRRQFNQWRN